MDKINVYSITGWLPLHYGGRTAAIFKRQAILQKSTLPIQAHIITWDFMHQNQEKKYKTKDGLWKEVIFHSPFCDMRQKLKQQATTSVHDFMTEHLGAYDCMFKYQPTYRTEYYYRSGVPYYDVVRETAEETSAIQKVHIYEPTGTKVVYTLYCDEQERIYKIKEEKEEGYDLHLLCHNQCYCTLHKSANKGDFSSLQMYYNFEGQPIPTKYYSMNDFFTTYFETRIQEKSVVINDERKLDAPLAKAKLNSKRYFLIHSNHIINQKIRPSYRFLLSGDYEADLIVLTQEQKQDLLQENPALATHPIHIIPHMASYSSCDDLWNNSYEIVTISRLAPEKRILDVIKAFQIFHERFPQYHLNIYGEGVEKEKLEAYITSQHLQNVSLKGRTNMPNYIFSKASMTVVASQFEGFSLAISESLSNGCPVVAYPIKYGPKDMLQQNNGLIVEEETVEALAQGLQTMAEKIEQQRIHRRAIMETHLQHFGLKIVEAQWEALLQSALSQLEVASK